MAGPSLATRLANRLERLRQRRWRLASYHSEQPHIVMGGAPRSGTTVLRKLLDRHPHICAGAETKLFVPAAFNLEWLAQSYDLPLAELVATRAAAPSQAAFIDAFAERVLAAAGKVRWAEKTPQNIRYLDWILARFPEASIVHVIRDGRDVVCSMRQHPDWRWVDGGWQKVLVPRPIDWYARRWLDDTGAGLAWRDDRRYVEIRYEDLVADPPAILDAICRGVGAPADEAWLARAGRAPEARPTGGNGPSVEVGQPAERADPSAATGRPDYEGAVSDVSVGRWRTDLDDGERREVERICGPRLRELGYDV